MSQSFLDRLCPAVTGGGFSLEKDWVWCGSVVADDQGKYHMYASSWSKELAFSPHWLTNSQVIHAVSDTPQGPYEFESVALEPRGEGFWDGRMTHNPTVHRHPDGRYILYYTGTTYDAPFPTPQTPASPKLSKIEARGNQRIGIAIADNPNGPWQRFDEPLIAPQPGKWDGWMNTNPAAVIHPDGSVLLYYKAVAHSEDLLRYGVARADQVQGPYTRLTDEPIFNFDSSNDHIEDAYAWYSGQSYEMIFKDMAGGICGQKMAGVHALSDDGVQWRLAEKPLAYSRKVTWDDGTTTEQPFLERPQLLIQDGKPTHLFAATGSMPDVTLFDHGKLEHTWNMCIPMK
ncbi:MAG: glycoside hydrolase family protein [Phycisphaeraceae bacterium]|nr:glycoside hydrolase family protein [Phycisphaeraceae bacterium]